MLLIENLLEALQSIIRTYFTVSLKTVFVAAKHKSVQKNCHLLQNLPNESDVLLVSHKMRSILESN